MITTNKREYTRFKHSRLSCDSSNRTFINAQYLIAKIDSLYHITYMISFALYHISYYMSLYPYFSWNHFKEIVAVLLFLIIICSATQNVILCKYILSSVSLSRNDKRNKLIGISNCFINAVKCVKLTKVFSQWNRFFRTQGKFPIVFVSLYKPQVISFVRPPHQYFFKVNEVEISGWDSSWEMVVNRSELRIKGGFINYSGGQAFIFNDKLFFSCIIFIVEKVQRPVIINIELAW